MDCRRDACNHAAAAMGQHERTSVGRFVRGLAAAGALAVALLASGCLADRTGLAEEGGTDGGRAVDSGRGDVPDLGSTDLGGSDLGRVDPGTDAGPTLVDLGPPDLGVDFGVDLGPTPACGAMCTADQVCVAGRCVGCGRGFQPCCDMDRCTTGFVCALGLGCTNCGGRFQPCCVGDTCNGGLSCSFGVCG